jgi:flagellar protein FlaG
MRIDALSSNRGSSSPATEARPTARDADVPKEPVQPQPAEQAQQAATVTTVEAAARQIESYLKSVGRSLEFRVDAETRRTVVTIRDTTSGEVIRQIPGDEMLSLARHLQQNAGNVLDLTV